MLDNTTDNAIEVRDDACSASFGTKRPQVQILPPRLSVGPLPENDLGDGPADSLLRGAFRSVPAPDPFASCRFDFLSPSRYGNPRHCAAVYPTPRQLRDGPFKTVDEDFDGLPSMEAIATCYAAQVSGIPFVRGPFRRVTKAISDAVSPNDTDAIRAAFGFFGGLAPDAFAVMDQYAYTDWPINHLWLLEIEDTSKLSPEKLDSYCALWDDFDATDYWELHLYITDRYGRGAELDLQGMYYAIANAINRRSQPLDHVAKLVPSAATPKARSL